MEDKLIFCENCFKDAEIKKRIQKMSELKGNCPLCKGENKKLYDTDEYSFLDNIFDDIISNYTHELIEGHSKSEYFPIEKHIREEWDIFQIECLDDIFHIINFLSIDYGIYKPELLTKKVIYKFQYHDEELNDNLIIKDEDWDEFVNSLKHKNRFHTSDFNKNLFLKMCSYMSKTIPENEKFYRARISRTGLKFECSDLGAPPKEKAQEGRANSRGISHLYIANSTETALLEVRSGAHDFVTVGKFRLLKDIAIVDLDKILKISPFLDEFKSLHYLLNRKTFKKINREISKPLLRGDSTLDYLPTQYIVDVIKSSITNGSPTYQGIKYKSSINLKGYNLVIFDPDLLVCEDNTHYSIDSIDYQKSIVE